MAKKGIRISDGQEKILSVSLSDILDLIDDKDSLNWSILFVDGTFNRGQGLLFQEYQTMVNNSKEGIQVSWKELKEISEKYFQMYEVIVLADRDLNHLRRYESEAEMINACDIVIELIDCVFWEVYSSDNDLINKFKRQFQEIELLENYTDTVSIFGFFFF